MKTLVKDVLLAAVCSVAAMIFICLFLQWFKNGGAAWLMGL